jgi:hypothetical protein
LIGYAEAVFFEWYNPFVQSYSAAAQEWATGSDTTIVCYNASAVKIYGAKISLVRFEHKNILFYFEKTR